jgi:hypothetical protein
VAVLAFGGELPEANVERNDRIRFVQPASSLGLPHVLEFGDVKFSGKVSLTGTVTVEPETPELCSGACAYFIPDEASQKLLPRVIGVSGPHDVEKINLYDAEVIVNEVFGTREARVLLSRRTSFDFPAEVTLSEYTVYRACDRTHHEAVLVDVRQTGGAVIMGRQRFEAGC